MSEAKGKLIRLPATDELLIAEVQLERLRQIAMERLLTPDETKQYDILVKNVMLIRGQPTTITGTSSRVDELSEDKLIEIASVPEDPNKNE